MLNYKFSSLVYLLVVFFVCSTLIGCPPRDGGGGNGGGNGGTKTELEGTWGEEGDENREFIFSGSNFRIEEKINLSELMGSPVEKAEDVELTSNIRGTFTLDTDQDPKHIDFIKKSFELLYDEAELDTETLEGVQGIEEAMEEIFEEIIMAKTSLGVYMIEGKTMLINLGEVVYTERSMLEDPGTITLVKK